MKNLQKIFKNKKIIITGHTGFKGSWLAFWLNSLGAKVLGISNDKISYPSNFSVLRLKKKIKHVNLDINNFAKFKKTIKNYEPDFIFHLAAQALVKESYKNPLYTFNTNSIGTLNLLETLKNFKKKCIVILITSDKSYKNLEIKRGYKEDDALGGFDPYSASKACAEIIIQSYVNSFLKNYNNKILLGVARAGNVVGGGDWSADRLIPDCVKSWSKNKKVILRNPSSTRPWQHVFEALSGYLVFASKLKSNPKLHGNAINFGPNSKTSYSVLSIVKEMKKNWEKVSWKIKKSKSGDHESNLLKLNCSKAKKKLNWKSILNFNEISKMTSQWYKKYYSDEKGIVKFSTKQLKYFEELMKERL